MVGEPLSLFPRSVANGTRFLWIPSVEDSMNIVNYFLDEGKSVLRKRRLIALTIRSPRRGVSLLN
jgi:hypothetical protein